MELKIRSMIKVMFVCLGNICRSPLAEAIFNHKVRLRGLDAKLLSDSSGTSHWHIADPPDPRTIEIATDHGVPMNHKGRQFTAGDAENYHYIIAMDRENKAVIDTLLKNKSPKARMYMMGDFDRLASGSDVPDPYYGDKNDFQEVYDILDRSCENLINHLVNPHHLQERE